MTNAVEEETARLVKSLGPGVITGAADDDPSGIATYSQAGAQFGVNMLWTLVLTYPLMAGIQMVAAHIGRVTGRGLAANVKKAFPRWVLYPFVLLLLVANTINISADIAAMGEAAKLIAPEALPTMGYTVGFGVLSLLIQVFMPYRTYVHLLKWLTLALLTYVGVVFTVHIPWREVALRTFVPSFKLDAKAFTMVTAVFGTTISPYLFFWQASQEVEEIKNGNGHALRSAPREAKSALMGVDLDTWTGMFFSNAVAFFIILTTAVTLHTHGVTQIDTAAQAATALKPIAGPLAFTLFAAGILGTGLLAIPVLSGAAGYAVAECFGWREGLGLEPLHAVGFYGVVALATLGGILLTFLGVNPIQALFWSAVINGVVSAPIMAVTMIVASRPSIMGRFVIKPRLKLLGWLATAVMAAAAAGMFAG